MSQRKPISMTIPVDLIEYLDKVAKENGLTRSATATMVISQYKSHFEMHSIKEVKGEKQ